MDPITQITLKVPYCRHYYDEINEVVLDYLKPKLLLNIDYSRTSVRRDLGVIDSLN